MPSVVLLKNIKPSAPTSFPSARASPLASCCTFASSPTLARSLRSTSAMAGLLVSSAVSNPTRSAVSAAPTTATRADVGVVAGGAGACPKTHCSPESRIIPRQKKRIITKASVTSISSTWEAFVRPVYLRPFAGRLSRRSGFRYRYPPGSRGPSRAVRVSRRVQF